MLLGLVNAGYRIRDGEWMEIGRMSPQKPQVQLRLRVASFSAVQAGFCNGGSVFYPFTFPSLLSLLFHAFPSLPFHSLKERSQVK